MILSVWKPVYKSSKIIRYDLLDKNILLQKKGTTAFKVIWVCDNTKCKTPKLTHSISACHLIKEKMCFNKQICRACQCTGEGNGRYGDNRTWEELYNEETIKKLKYNLSNKWSGEKNPSKKDEIKFKKGQVIINEDFIKNIIESKNFEYISLINLDGKRSEVLIKCPKEHILKKKYLNFIRKNKKFICEKCFYESIGLKLSDKEIEEFRIYSKVVRALTAKTYKLNKNYINPKNLEIGKNKNHIDHRYSVFEGFRNKVNPKIISSKENLEVIPAKQNLSKLYKCSISLEELNDKIRYL